MSENESSRSDNKNSTNKEGDEKEKLRELVRAVKHAKRERFFKGVVVPFWWFLKVLVLFFSLVFLQNDEAKKVEALQQKYSPIEDRNIREASGLVKSKLNSKSPAGKVFWTHNDSGDRARVFAIRVPEKDDDAKSSKKTRVVAEVTILNAGNRDWEDLALWQDHKTNQQKLCAGDIGSYRGEVVIYCFPEPKLSEMSEDVFKRLQAAFERVLKSTVHGKDSPAIPIQRKARRGNFTGGSTHFAIPHRHQKKQQQRRFIRLRTDRRVIAKFERIERVKIRAND